MSLACSTGSSSHPSSAMNQSKYKISAVVLLLFLIPEATPSSLKTINPWLSACDITHPLVPELQGSCSSRNPRLDQQKRKEAGVIACPRDCPHNGSIALAPGCLHYLDDFRKNIICNFNPNVHRGWIKSLLAEIRLRNCCEHKAVESLAGPLMDKVLRGKGECYKVIDNLISVDKLAGRVACQFNDVMSRFDCNHAYSVRFSCEHCKEAYRRWVCTTLIPFFNGTVRIKPCRSLCQVVEQKCPYFLPENRAPSLPTQYAGEPAFLCTDPNIPESAEQQLRSIHPPEGSCCVKPCGIPYKGLCIEPGNYCDAKSSHSNITSTDCSELEGSSGRGHSTRCPGPSAPPDPRALFSVITSHPVLAISTILTLQASHPFRHVLLLLPFLVFLPSSYLGVVILATLLCFSSLPAITGLLEINASYQLYKISKSILNYFIPDCDVEQCSLMPISVHFRNGMSLVFRLPSPIPTPMPERHYRLRSGYLGEQCKRRCIQKLQTGTEELVRRNLLRLTPDDAKSLSDCLSTGTLVNDEGGIGIKCKGSTINGAGDHRPKVAKPVPMKIFGFSLKRAARQAGNVLIKRVKKVNYILHYLYDRLVLFLKNSPYLRWNVICKAILIFLYGLTSYRFVRHFFESYHIAKRDREMRRTRLRRVPISAETPGPSHR